MWLRSTLKTDLGRVRKCQAVDADDFLMHFRFKAARDAIQNVLLTQVRRCRQNRARFLSGNLTGWVILAALASRSTDNI